MQSAERFMAASLHQASLCEADIYPTIPCFHSIFPSVSMGCFQFPVMVTATIKKKEIEKMLGLMYGDEDINFVVIRFTQQFLEVGRGLQKEVVLYSFLVLA